MSCIQYSQNNPDSSGDWYSGFSSAFTLEEAWKCVFFSNQTLVSISLILLLGPWILLLSGVSGSAIPGGVFFCFKTKKKSFLDLSFSFHVWINDSFNPARHCRKSTLIFSSGGLPCPSGYGFYPEAGGGLDVNCCYLIAVYNTQRGTGWIRGQGWSYRSVDGRIWLLWKQVKAGINTSYSGW